jgi:hypothetical protein
MVVVVGVLAMVGVLVGVATIGVLAAFGVEVGLGCAVGALGFTVGVAPADAIDGVCEFMLELLWALLPCGGVTLDWAW